ncbi:MAG: copper resistance protein NlpE N-terminal domain-containing protein [Candidatus Pacebacteria bacterium]|nr:copper resistance protein NlpE N-terminal domain-containing protein [Candidatus Paceibacterota bacterium]MBP9866719.1 copper resistance protein NlpE N-terminal domain-containing protein [Candidatus Paceibacterota bacterium]
MNKHKILAIIMAGGIALTGIYVSFAEENDELSFDLKFGQRGTQITKLQDFLIEKGYLNTNSTGYFGRMTANAVARYQKENNLDSVGRVGPLTRKAMNKDMRTLKEFKKKGDDHSTQNSLDVDGVYSGTLPCASCSGIETTLELNKGTYTLVEKYLKSDTLVSTTTGSFTWKDKNVIQLTGIATGTRSVMYKVGENTITQLNMDGNMVTGETAPFYTLKKVVATGYFVEDKKWKMVELEGKPITGSVETYYIVLHSKEKRLETKAGCNQMGGMYTLDGYRFKTSGVFSTMMACENMNDEQAFSKVLELADNISYSETNLSFNKARMAPLARFELVK